MSITLAVDAATYVGTVAVLRDGVLVAERQTAMRGEREERLMPAVAAALAAADARARDIERVVCGAGPGSFTSLRIAAAIAKGLAVAADAPLFALSSLLLVVAGARPPLAPGRYLPMLDAMRGDVFAETIVVLSGAIRIEEPAILVSRAEIERHAAAKEAQVVGPAQALDLAPHARGAALLGRELAWPEPVEIASWEPRYGRLAEAQVKWEAAHGRALGTWGASA